MPTIIKLFESENILKCKNRLLDFIENYVYFMTVIKHFSRQASLTRQAFLITPLHGKKKITPKK